MEKKEEEKRKINNTLCLYRSLLTLHYRAASDTLDKI
jgi:hypothetical protein